MAVGVQVPLQAPDYSIDNKEVNCSIPPQMAQFLTVVIEDRYK
jgi:hypothetical protein